MVARFFGLLRVIHLRQLRRQRVRTALAIVSVGAGVAFMVAATLLAASIDGSVKDAMRDLGGPSPLRVVGPLQRGGLDEKVAGQVAQVDGVEAAVPVVIAVTIGESRSGDATHIVALGADCRVEALSGAFGCDDETLRPPRQDAPLLMSASLASSLGRDGVIRTDVGRVDVAGVAVNDTLDDFNDGRVAVFALPTAQRLFERSERLDAVYVLPEPRADVEELRGRIQRAVGEWNSVLTQTELASWQGSFGPLIPLLGFVGIISLGLSGLLVLNIVSLSLAERRRDLAIAGAIGVTPRALITGTMAEASLLGVVGGVIGAIAGIGLAHPIVGSISSLITERALGIPIRVHVPIGVLVAGVALGALAAAAAAFVPARRAVRLELAAELHGRALREEAAPRRTVVRAAVAVALATVSVALSYVAQRNGALSPWQPPLGAFVLLTTSIASFAAAGAAAPLVLGLVLRPLRRARGSLGVAVANLVRRPRRTSMIAVATSAAVGMASVLAALVPAVRGVADDYYGGADDDLVWVSTLSTNGGANIDARPSSEVLERLAEVPGVKSLEPILAVNTGDDDGEYFVSAYDDRMVVPFNVVDGRADADVFKRGDAVVATGVARNRGLAVGSLLTIRTPTGIDRVRVGGIVTDSSNNGYVVRVSSDRFHELFGKQPPREVFLRAADGVPTTELAARVNAARLDPDLYALTADELAALISEEIGDQVEIFWTMQRALLLVSLIATLSVLLLIGVQRRREFGILGAVGFGPSALARLTLAEAAAAAGVGAVLGAAGSLWVFEALRNIAAASVGARPPFRVAPMGAVGATAIALVVVTVGALLPAWRASRLQIVEALRDE